MYKKRTCIVKNFQYYKTSQIKRVVITSDMNGEFNRYLQHQIINNPLPQTQTAVLQKASSSKYTLGEKKSSYPY